jgi:hypothetical protein
MTLTDLLIRRTSFRAQPMTGLRSCPHEAAS